MRNFTQIKFLVLALWFIPQGLFTYATASIFEAEEDLMLATMGLLNPSKHQYQKWDEYQSDYAQYSWDYDGASQQDSLWLNNSEHQLRVGGSNYVFTAQRLNERRKIFSNGGLYQSYKQEVNLSLQFQWTQASWWSLSQKIRTQAGQLGTAFQLGLGQSKQFQLLVDYQPDLKTHWIGIDQDRIALKSKENIWALSALYAWSWGEWNSQIAWERKWNSHLRHQEKFQLDDSFVKQTLNYELEQAEWKFNTSYTRLNREFSLQYFDVTQPFSRAKYQTDLLEASVEGTYGGLASDMAEIDSPVPEVDLTVDPSYYPKEGLESFWFLTQVQYVRWGGNWRHLSLKPFVQYPVKFANFKWTPKVQYLKTWVYYQSLTETHEMWLYIVPIQEKSTEVDSKLLSVESLLLSSDFSYEWKNWALNLNVKQWIPRSLPEVDQKITTNTKQTGKTTTQVETKTAKLAGSEEDEQTYNLGEGLNLQLTLRYNF